MIYSSRKFFIACGFFSFNSEERSLLPSCLDSSSTMPWACSIQRSQIWASRPAISRLVSGFFLPQKEHSNSSFAIILRFSFRLERTPDYLNYSTSGSLAPYKYFINHTILDGFLSFHPIIPVTVLVYFLVRLT